MGRDVDAAESDDGAADDEEYQDHAEDNASPKYSIAGRYLEVLPINIFGDGHLLLPQHQLAVLKRYLLCLFGQAATTKISTADMAALI